MSNGKNNSMKKTLLFLTAISAFLLYACKETITVTPKSSDKQLLTFKINNITEESNTVDQTSRNIRIVVAAKTDRKSLTPTITLSPKATVSPASGVAQDFTNPVKYTVTAEDGTTQIYNVVVDVKMSSDKVISEFKFSGLIPEVKATIAGTNIDATVPSGTDLKTLVPTLMLSAGSTVSPESGKAQDFTTSPVKYTVTAEDGTKQDYLVKITVAKSSEKQITEFRLEEYTPDVLGRIDQSTNTISVVLPAGTNLKGIIPTIKLSALATITPTSRTAQDFTNTVNYTVKAEDGSTQVYRVTVTAATINTNKYAYVGCNYNYVFCLDAKTGVTNWKVQLAPNNLAIDSSPTYANGIVYVTVNSISTIFALDAETGAKKWQVKLKGFVQSSPTVLNGVVYIGSSFNTFYALDALTGAEKWTYSQGDLSASHETSRFS